MADIPDNLADFLFFSSCFLGSLWPLVVRLGLSQGWSRDWGLRGKRASPHLLGGLRDAQRCWLYVMRTRLALVPTGLPTARPPQPWVLDAAMEAGSLQEGRKLGQLPSQRPGGRLYLPPLPFLPPLPLLQPPILAELLPQVPPPLSIPHLFKNTLSVSAERVIQRLWLSL